MHSPFRQQFSLFFLVFLNLIIAVVCFFFSHSMRSLGGAGAVVAVAAYFEFSVICVSVQVKNSILLLYANIPFKRNDLSRILLFCHFNSMFRVDGCANKLTQISHLFNSFPSILLLFLHVYEICYLHVVIFRSQL